MQSKRALLISLVLAVLAVALMYFYTNKKIDLITRRYKPGIVVVASKNIPQNTILDETMLEYKRIPEPFIEPNAIMDKAQRVGYLTAITIKQGEQITEQKLLSLSERISSIIPKGMRAITLSVNEITGVGGLLRPKDNVDIIGIFRTQGKTGRVADSAEAVTLLQNVRVLSVGRFYSIESIPTGKDTPARTSGGVNFSNITVLLTPRQAMDLALAQDLGSITLSLRPRFDYDPPRKDSNLRNKSSTPSSATGLSKKLNISPGPRWLEERGGQTTWVR